MRRYRKNEMSVAKLRGKDGTVDLKESSKILLTSILREHGMTTWTKYSSVAAIVHMDMGLCVQYEMEVRDYQLLRTEYFL
jgi:hypothetical protein